MALSIKRQNRYVPHFSGNRELPEAEQVSVAYRTMTVGDVLAVQEETGVNILTGDRLETDKAFQTNWSVISTIVEKYWSDWRNMAVDGQSVTDSKAVLEAFSIRYLGLFAELFQYILVASLGTEEDAKNFVPGSAQTQAAPDTTADPAATTTSESETAAAST